MDFSQNDGPGAIILRFDFGMLMSRAVNLIVLFPEDYIREGEVRLSGRRALHVLEVHRARAGATLRVGLLNGRTGTGVVRDAGGGVVELTVSLTDEPPAPIPVTLLLAMPRPKCFRRVIQCVTTLGVKRLALFGAYRVEKSYWQSPWLAGEALREQLILGLEQARDTVLPDITLHPHFKPFVEDVVPSLTDGTRRLVAHPGGGGTCPSAVSGPVSLAIGPEGGFTDYEFSRLVAAGFEPVSLGARILRTEQAVPALLGRLLPA
jgi:RsmE family RNA methyltransferase